MFSTFFAAKDGAAKDGTQNPILIDQVDRRNFGREGEIGQRVKCGG
jgi:hypothetical protein